MVSEWYEGVTLSSELFPNGEAIYRLTLANRGSATLSDFRLGFSGPGRISAGSPVANGSFVTQLSNYTEVAPPRGFTLAPGAEWIVDFEQLDHPIRHWTDGATTGFLILANGSTRSLPTTPTRLYSVDTAPKRGTMRFPIPAEPPVSASIVPWPQNVEVHGRRTAPRGLFLDFDKSQGAVREAIEGFRYITETLFRGEGLYRSTHEDGYPIEFAEGPGGIEGYTIEFFADRARIRAENHAGYLYALVTLGQMVRGARTNPQQFSFPAAGRIEDAPNYKWRGSHLDVARRFYAVDEVRRFIALLAWNKLDVLHWHLSDDEAWRVEIEAYPELTKKAAWNGYGLPIPSLLGSGPERSGGYYSKDDIGGIIGFATLLGVDVVPEIDIPGHCYALLQAIPQLRDPGENGLYHSIQSFPNNCLNPGVEATYGAIETIFGEMVELFPSHYFHVGADEVPHDAWETSPAARTLGATLSSDGTMSLQAHFLQRVQAFLTSKGKITGAWEEAALGGGIDKAGSYLVGWKDTAVSQKLAGEGYDVVVAPAQAYYMDMAHSEEFAECGAAWAGWSSLENTYKFEPATGWNALERGHLMGIQACIWNEPMTDRAVFDRLVFHRLSAIAETAWSTNRDFTRFSALVGTMPNMYGNYEEA